MARDESWNSDEDPIIRPMPTRYRGQLYRSSLEASWAATFDHLRIRFVYEPLTLKVQGYGYVPDFHLPMQNTWCEVKGPHNERLYKPRDVALGIEKDEWKIGQPLIVVLRPPIPGDIADWGNLTPNQDIVMTYCTGPKGCDGYAFMNRTDGWGCRNCHQEGKFWKLPGCDLYEPGSIVPFRRAGR